MTVEPTDTPRALDLIGRLHRELTSRLIAGLRTNGFEDVTPAFAALMPFIGLEGSRQSDIAKRAQLTKQAVGQLVKELAARGYVGVRRDPVSARATLVAFTERGLALRDKGFALKRELLSEMERALGEEGLGVFEQSTRILLAQVGSAAN